MINSTRIKFSGSVGRSHGNTDGLLSLMLSTLALFWAISWFSKLLFIGVVSAFFGSFFFVWWVWRFYCDPRGLVRMLQFGAVSLTGILNVGFVLSWCVSVMSVSIPLGDLLMEVYGITVFDYFRALFFAQIFAVSISLVAQLKIFRIGEGSLVRNLSGVVDTSVSFFVGFYVFVTIMVFALAASGILGYRNFNVQGFSEGEIPWYYDLFMALQALSPALGVCLLIKALRGRSFFWFVFFALGVAVNLVGAFAAGRRALIMACVLYGFYYVILVGRRVSRFKMGIALAVMLVAIYPATVFNNFIRTGASGVTDARSRGLTNVFWEAAESYKYSDSQDLARESAARNLATRPLVAHPVAVVQNAPSSQVKWGLGVEYRNAFYWTIPRFIFPAKFRYPVQEAFIYKYAGVAFVDTADSIYLSAYLNFGWLGAFLGVLPLAFLWLIVLWLISILRHPFFKLIIFSQWVSCFMVGVGELSLVSWFVQFRLSIALFVVLFVLEHLFLGGGVTGRKSIKSRKRV